VITKYGGTASQSKTPEKQVSRHPKMREPDKATASLPNALLYRDIGSSDLSVFREIALILGLIS
jgi:hypothetical protein